FLRGATIFKRRANQMPLPMVMEPQHCLQILTYAYDNLGHRGVYGVFYHIQDRFFWSHMLQDVKHHVSSCY
ncbi:hypothetical protein OBBRIDRAFT_738880, partial [Obba rivulosa]